MKRIGAKLIVAALAATLTVTVAAAQHDAHEDMKEKRRPVDNKPKVDEKAYTDALKSLPPADNKPRDPWAGAR